jgi:hypothetical protein
MRASRELTTSRKREPPELIDRNRSTAVVLGRRDVRSVASGDAAAKRQAVEARQQARIKFDVSTALPWHTATTRLPRRSPAL